MLCNGFEEIPPTWFGGKFCLQRNGKNLVSNIFGAILLQPMLTHKTTPLPESLRGQLYNGGRPPVGGLLHKAPVEEKL